VESWDGVHRVGWWVLVIQGIQEAVGLDHGPGHVVGPFEHLGLNVVQNKAQHPSIVTQSPDTFCRKSATICGTGGFSEVLFEELTHEEHRAPLNVDDIDSGGHGIVRNQSDHSFH
jgi:hypothetical protein